MLDKPHLARTQVVVAMAIVLGFYAMAIIAPLAKLEIDPGMLETSKNVMLILVGYLFGSSTTAAARKDSAPPIAIAAAAAPAPAGQPAFAETQPQKDRP